MSNTNSNDDTSMPLNLPISLVPFNIQLFNVVPIDIHAQRHPVVFTPETPLNSEINIAGISLDAEHQQAQVIIETKVESTTEPKPFEIVLKVVGIFTYPENYSANEVAEYLQSGSISAILPFIREMIFHLSTRLQIPPIMLPTIQLAPPTEREQPE